MRSFVAVLAATLVPFLTPAAASGQVADPARAPVEGLNGGLIAIMKLGRSAGFHARAAAIGPVVDRSFDLPLMTRLAVGAPWTSFTPADQAALVTAFRRMTIAQYAENFDGFSGQSFTIDARVETRGGDKLIRTTLAARSGDPVILSYRVRQTSGAWRIIDVFYRNAISQLATRRSDFAGIVSSGGAKALIAHLDALSAKAAG